MAGQPANSTITVFRNVRTYRQDLRHESVKALTGNLRPLVFSVPGEETLVIPGTRATPTDFSSYMGEARPGATRGLPITIGTRAAKAWSTVTSLTDAGIPFTIGSDRFVEPRTAALAESGDLHENLRDA